MLSAESSAAVRPKQFYAEALTAAERADLPRALEVEGVDEEIAVLRLRLRSALEERPDDLLLMFKGVELLARAVAARYRLTKGSERDLAATLHDALRELGVMLPDDLAPSVPLSVDPSADLRAGSEGEARTGQQSDA